MSISLIVTRSIDREFNETGDSISAHEWNAFVDSDPEITFRSDPIVARAPNGIELKMNVPPGQTELTLPSGERIPFLTLCDGELFMEYSRVLESSANVVRQKVAHIAKCFNALINTDAGDELLNW
jgi:hypothetical protein